MSGFPAAANHRGPLGALLGALLALVFWTGSARPAHADTAAEAVPCRPGSAPHREATQALTALSAQIEALTPAADPQPANTALVALLAHPCLRLAKDEGPAKRQADSALALQTFWNEGGKEWLQSYLDITKAPDDGGRRAVIPAAMRTTLSKEAYRDHALAPLICSLVDSDCIARTGGWAARAGHAFDRQRDSEAEQDMRTACEHKARKAPAAKRYAVWRACIEELPLEEVALPLGGLDVPAQGWLVIHGRRGHYQFCDEIRAYDLATGSAFLAQSCSGLFLGLGGDVDQAQTDAKRGVQARAGQLIRDNLREAAWMMLTLPFVDEPAVRWTESFDIPAGIVPRRSTSVVDEERRVHIVSSDQTTLAWSYVHQGMVLATGTLTWPYDHQDAAHNHAVRLLEIAEGGFVAGCPRSVLPAGLVSMARLGARAGVSPVDASPDSLERANDQLGEAMERLRQNAVQGTGKCQRAPGARRSGNPAPGVPGSKRK